MAQQLQSENKKIFNLQCKKKPGKDINNKMYRSISDSFYHLKSHGGVNCSLLKKRLAKEYKYACFVIKNQEWSKNTWDWAGFEASYSKWIYCGDQYIICIIIGLQNGYKQSF